MPTGLGRSLVEVQRCPTALRTLRLRSSRAHSDRCPLRAEVGEERRVGKAAVDVDVEAEVGNKNNNGFGPSTEPRVRQRSVSPLSLSIYPLGQHMLRIVPLSQLTFIGILSLTHHFFHLLH